MHGKGNRVDVFRSQLGDDLILLDCKEVENLLPEEIVRTVVRTLAEGTIDDALASKITSEEYQVPGRGLGEYLDRVLGINDFAEKSGTIKRKNLVCDLAVEAMQNARTWKLTPGAELLCRRITEFVKKANGMA